MVYAGKTTQGDLLLELEVSHAFPGNGVAIPGQEMTGGQLILCGFILPHPKSGLEKTVNFLINDNIKPRLPEGKKREYSRQVKELLTKYEGLEIDTIFCLRYALQGRKFEETVSRLEEFYTTHLRQSSLPAFMRCTSERAANFFKRLYEFVEAKNYQASS